MGRGLRQLGTALESADHSAMPDPTPATAELDRYAVDGVAPSDVVAPQSLDELREVLRQCHADGRGVIPIAGGTRMSVGNLPSRYDVALDLSGMPATFEHEPGDMTVVCDASANVTEVEMALNDASQRLPFRVPDPGRATIGGSVASGAGGRLRYRFGGVREWVIGMSVVSADGIVTKSGGRVVKNVQGFDLHRLHTGAFGTLGIITSVAFKLVPLPRHSTTVAMWFEDLDTALTVATQVASLGLEADSVRLYAGDAATVAVRDLQPDDGTSGDYDAEGLMLTKLAGSVSSVRSQLERLRGFSGTVPVAGYADAGTAELGADLWDDLDRSTEQGPLAVQFSGRASATAALLRRLHRELGDETGANFALDAGYGSLQMSVGARDDVDALGPLLQQITSAARDSRCDYLIGRCPTAVKSEVNVFGIDAGLEAIMRRTKMQFDPDAILNRGRYAFGI